jgi:signal transduction histidine kinase
MFDLALQCSDAPNAFLGIFDFSIAPPLLFYAYVPISAIALLLGVFVLINDTYSYRSKLLLSLSVVFSLLLANEILQWIAAPVSLVQFGWEMVPFFRVAAAVLTVWFVYVFCNGRGLPFYQQIILSSFLVVVTLLLGTRANIVFFDLNNCEGVSGWLWDVTHVLEVISMLWIVGITYGAVKRKGLSREDEVKTLLLGGGAVLFLLIFVAASVWGDFTQVYDVALVGPLGMLLFMIFLTFIIVRYRAFSIKLVGAQALVFALIVLIGSQFFFIHNTTSQIIVAATLVLTGVIGINLVRSVKKEVALREHVEKLAEELQDTNERQEGLIHFIGHEVKGFLTKDAGSFAALLDGDYAPLPEALKPFVDSALIESRQGADAVASILKASNLKKGTVTYSKALFDLKALVAEAVEKERMVAEHKGLTLTYTAEGGAFQYSGDRAQISDHVLRNLIDNAINYTPTGSVAVTLSRAANSIIFSVKDTGVGITDEDKRRLFTEGGHGKDSQTINAHSTGYGLYIAKRITEAHGGTIRVESEGQGKGSEFIVEFPSVA